MLQMSRLRDGQWEGIIASEVSPDLVVTHHGKVVGELAVEQIKPGRWRLSLPLPVALISEGVQSFVISERTGGDTIDRFSIIAGRVLDEDIRVELEVLREELTLLKAAFRRHCAQGAQE